MGRYCISNSTSISDGGKTVNIYVHTDAKYENILRTAKNIVAQSLSYLDLTLASMQSDREVKDAYYVLMERRYFTGALSEECFLKLMSFLQAIRAGLSAQRLDIKVADTLHKYGRKAAAISEIAIAGSTADNENPNPLIGGKVMVTKVVDGRTDSVLRNVSKEEDKPYASYIPGIHDKESIAADRSAAIPENQIVRTGQIHLQKSSFDVLTLIHEASHKFAGTIDITYFDICDECDFQGTRAGKARNNCLGSPARAIWNADSIAWFVVNYSKYRYNANAIKSANATKSARAEQRTREIEENDTTPRKRLFIIPKGVGSTF